MPLSLFHEMTLLHDFIVVEEFFALIKKEKKVIKTNNFFQLENDKSKSFFSFADKSIRQIVKKLCKKKHYYLTRKKRTEKKANFVDTTDYNPEEQIS